MGPKELAQIVADQEGLITAYKQQVRCLTTLKTREDLFQQNCDTHRKHIADHQAKLDRLIFEHDHADELIAEAEANIRRLRKEITLLKNQAGIAKLLELAARINDLQNVEDEEE